MKIKDYYCPICDEFRNKSKCRKCSTTCIDVSLFIKDLISKRTIDQSSEVHRKILNEVFNN